MVILDTAAQVRSGIQISRHKKKKRMRRPAAGKGPMLKHRSGARCAVPRARGEPALPAMMTLYDRKYMNYNYSHQHTKCIYMYMHTDKNCTSTYVGTYMVDGTVWCTMAICEM